MMSQDFRSPNGSLQVHLSVLDNSSCYIYVLNCLDQKLTMRFFADISIATEWIRLQIDPEEFL